MGRIKNALNLFAMEVQIVPVDIIAMTYNFTGMTGKQEYALEILFLDQYLQEDPKFAMVAVNAQQENIAMMKKYGEEME
jgi:hypothetical protein